MYGTQFDDRGMYAVGDSAEMIRLRKELLMKAHDHDAMVESTASAHADLHPHDKEFSHWRKKVGWI